MICFYPGRAAIVNDYDMFLMRKILNNRDRIEWTYDLKVVLL